MNTTKRNKLVKVTFGLPENLRQELVAFQPTTVTQGGVTREVNQQDLKDLIETFCELLNEGPEKYPGQFDDITNLLGEMQKTLAWRANR